MVDDIVHNDMVAALKSLLVSEKYSDLVFKCGSSTFCVHRALVCSRAPVLGALCDAKYEDEGEPQVLVLDQENPTVVEAMIEFLYTADYSIPQQSGLSAKAVHALLVLAADTYGIKSLKVHAKTKLAKVDSQPWLISDVPSIVRGVYAAKLPRNHILKDSVLKMIHRNFEMLMMDETYLRLLDDVAGLGLDLLKLVIETKHKVGFEAQRWQCPSCKEIFHFPVGVPWYCALCGDARPKKI